MAEGASTRGEVEVSDTQQEEGLTNDKKEEESKTQEQMEEPTNDKKEEGSDNQEQMLGWFIPFQKLLPMVS